MKSKSYYGTMMRFISNIRLLVCLTVLCSQAAFAWGPRGHHLITRVAVHLVGDTKHDALYQTLLKKELHLAYLSNTPDNVWRSRKVSKDVVSKNGPTHYFSSGKFMKEGSEEEFKKQLLKSLKAKGQFEKLKDVGSAPHRILQLHYLIKAEFQKLKGSKAKNDVLDRSVVLCGLASHFIGDLANPMHTITDYDGWGTNQGGLHGYFEADIVSQYGLDLENDVHVEAKKILNNYKFDAKNIENTLVKYLWESKTFINNIVELDKKHALQSPSVDKDGLKIKAKRKHPKDVKQHFRKLIVKRLAAGSAMLAQYWVATWTAAGAPTHEKYHSYFFDHTPEFIEPVY